MKGHMTAENNDTSIKVYLREIGRIRQLEIIALSKLRRMLSQKEYPIGVPLAA
jgi:hypothetical protein